MGSSPELLWFCMNLFANLVDKIEALDNPGCIYVAYSGGLDSHVLLYLLASLRTTQKIEVHALHINHQLHKDAQAWARHCCQVCEQLQVAITVKTVEAGAIAGESPEASARKARYDMLAQMGAANDLIALAHHQDDQAETLLIQLLRGAGVRGTAGMPELSVSSRLWRPLLAVPQAVLQQFAGHHQLQWVEDSSNASTVFDRNFIRHSVMPLIQSRWPGAVRTLCRVSALHAETDFLISRQARELLLKTQPEAKDWLDCNRLKRLSLAEIRIVLRAWIDTLTLPMPAEKQLNEIISNVINSRHDATPQVHWASVEARRYKNRLYLFPRLESFARDRVYDWDGQTPLDLPEISCQLVSVGTVSDSGYSQGQPVWRVFYRQGGETYLNQCGEPRRLKRIFQALDLPLWVRDRIPLIGIEGQVVAIGDLWMAPSFMQTATQSEFIIRLLKKNFGSEHAR